MLRSIRKKVAEQSFERIKRSMLMRENDDREQDEIDSDLESIKSFLFHHIVEKKWHEHFAIRLVKCLEEYNPQLEEDVACKRMEEIRKDAELVRDYPWTLLTKLYGKDKYCSEEAFRTITDAETARDNYQVGYPQDKFKIEATIKVLKRTYSNDDFEEITSEKAQKIIQDHIDGCDPEGLFQVFTSLFGVDVVR